MVEAKCLLFLQVRTTFHGLLKKYPMNKVFAIIKYVSSGNNGLDIKIPPVDCITYICTNSNHRTI